MATGQMNGVLEHVRRVALLPDGGGLSDGQLLHRFLAAHEETAFEALVRRHGAMVLGVCRRVLRNADDAEDAFQATFLVLLRKAAGLLPRPVIGNWLYGVAYHTALKARAQAAKRRHKEAQVTDMLRRDAPAPAVPDWQPVLDRELSRLPDKYREALVLCELEGKTRRQAAEQLGIPEGTLSGRLTTARRKLAQRLTRHGVTLSAGALAAVVSQSAASATVPAPLVACTVNAAAQLAAGQAAAGVVSLHVAALTEGVLKAMLMTKLKVTAAFLFLLGLAAAGTGILSQSASAGADPDRPIVTQSDQTILPATAREAAQRRPAQPKDEVSLSGALKAVDADKRSVTVSFSNRTEGQSEKTFELSKDAKVLRDGKEVKLSDLKPRARVTLKLSPDRKTAVSVSVIGPAITAQVKSVDATKNTVTVTMDNVRKGKQERVLNVAKDAKVLIDAKAARLTDLKEGTTLLFQLSAEDGTTVIQIQTPRRGRPNGEE